MRIYPNGCNPNVNKALNDITLTGDMGRADVSYINLYRPTTKIKLTKAIEDEQIVVVSINNEVLEKGTDYKISNDKLYIESLTPEHPWCENGVVKTAIIGVYTLKAKVESPLTVGDND